MEKCVGAVNECSRSKAEAKDGKSIFDERTEGSILRMGSREAIIFSPPMNWGQA